VNPTPAIPAPTDSPPSLAQQNTRLLAVAFVMLELIVMGLFAFWVMLPLARRSADDLAGLMVLSAQTWAELPPVTRPAFEVELLKSHALVLRADPPGAARDEWHPPYFYLLEDALARRTGHAQHLAREQLDSGTWYWASVPAGSGQLSVGLSASRIDSQPITAFFVAIFAGFAGASGISIWLARRLTRPLAQLEAASALIGQGGMPVLLPETGPLEMVRLSRRFNAMAQQVRDLLSTRTTLLAGVSHDLRTPLSRMRLALEMLRDKPDPGLIDRMDRDIEQMNQLIGQVLDLARGLAHEANVPTNVAALLQQLADEHANADTAILVNCPTVQLDVAPAALHRALGNLLQNALRYAPGQPVELVGDVSQTRMRLGVLDRGPGIAAEHLDAVFEPFHRLETSRSRATGGAGLGLAIVRELARVHGWQVQLQARPGGGLQAWITIEAPPQAAQA
jgi:two-component system, OmpR family, osmolarity sensor histidine kinase EnvZ